MNHLLRTCKCHWVGEEYQHWRLDGRRAFAPAGTPPKFAPDAPVVSTHMRLELHLDFDNERAWGQTTHLLRVQSGEARSVRFQAIGLEIGPVTVNGRKASAEYDGRELAVPLPKPGKGGGKLEVTIQHAVTKPSAGLYFTNPDADRPERFQTVWSQGQDEDSRYYFPCLDAPNFKQTSEALLYVPPGFFALSNGELLAHKPAGKGGGKGSKPVEDLWHYRLELPYSTYLFSVVAGRYAGHTERKHGVEVRWFVQPGREKEGRNAFGATGDILKFFGEFTGHPYPHAQYTQIAVPDFIFGGMENFTATTQTDLTLHDDRAHLDFSSDDLVAHEAAHTWFGNMVTARSWAHAWLHESFATYMEALYTRHKKNQEEYDFENLRNAESYFHEDSVYRRPLVTHQYEEPIDLFDAHLYPGGAARLRHLHALLGEDAFRGALRRFLENHKYGLAETVDLARAVEQETGLNYDWWFDQWIFCAGYPSLEVGTTWEEKDKTATVTIKQTQGLDRPQDASGTGAQNKKKPAYFRIPTHVAFGVGSGIETFPVTVEGEESRFVFRLPRKPSMVLFDPDLECPVKKVKLNLPQDLLLNQLTKAPGAVARIEAAAALAEKPAHAVVQTLGRQLRREKFWGAQQRIARALSKIGGDAARDALLTGLKVDHPKARREVVACLGHFKEDPRVGVGLVDMARKGDPSYYVEAELARALGRSRAKGALALLEKALATPSHHDVIPMGALDGLAELAHPDTLPLLEAAAKDHVRPLVRASALRALGALGRRHHELRKRTLEVLQLAVEQRGDPAGTFRGKLSAIRALGRLGEMDGLGALRSVAANEVNGRIARLARETAESVRKGADKPAELHELRTDLDAVSKENKGLRDRLETLEQKSSPPKGGGKGQSKARG